MIQSMKNQIQNPYCLGILGGALGGALEFTSQYFPQTNMDFPFIKITANICFVASGILLVKKTLDQRTFSREGEVIKSKKVRKAKQISKEKAMQEFLVKTVCILVGCSLISYGMISSYHKLTHSPNCGELMSHHLLSSLTQCPQGKELWEKVGPIRFVCQEGLLSPEIDMKTRTLFIDPKVEPTGGILFNIIMIIKYSRTTRELKPCKFTLNRFLKWRDEADYKIIQSVYHIARQCLDNQYWPLSWRESLEKRYGFSIDKELTFSQFLSHQKQTDVYFRYERVWRKACQSSIEIFNGLTTETLYSRRH